MPANLPGFYFDPEKGKYFRIQANHLAPINAKYSRQAVVAHRNALSETEYLQKHESFIARNRISKSAYFQRPHGLLLRRQLGNLHVSSATIMQKAYSSDLSSHRLFSELRSDVFAIEKESKQLFTISSPGGRTTRDFCVTKHTTVETSSGEGSGVEQTSHYPLSGTVPIYDTDQALRCVEPVNKDLVLWVTWPTEAGHEGVLGSRVHVSRRREHGWPVEEYGEWGTSVISAEDVIWDVKTRDDGRKLVLAGAGALLVCDVETGIRDSVWSVKELGQQKLKKEWMCAAWQGENIVIGGNRAGSIWLADVRVGGGAVRRAKCPWAVSAVRSVGREGLLVWGLEGGNLFDLRFNRAEATRKSRRKTTTRPALVFDVKDSWKQKRYGMGWDYDEQLGLVASGSTDLHERHSVGLWNVRTGRLLERSRSMKRNLASPVTCIQMVDLQGRGGVKSLLTACGGEIKSWAV